MRIITSRLGDVTREKSVSCQVGLDVGPVASVKVRSSSLRDKCSPSSALNHGEACAASVLQVTCKTQL